MEYADFVEKCINEYEENENEFIYQLIDPFCETVIEKTLSKKELKEILLKGMQKSIPLDKVKQAREEIDELDGEFLTIYDGTNKLGSGKYVYIEDVLEILDRLITESESWYGTRIKDTT